MPGEVGLLLESFGFGNDTRIYMTGAETTGGQRTLLPLRSTYPNLEDRFTMSTLRERSALDEAQKQQTSNFWLFWRTKSPPARAKGWWRSVGDCESNAEGYFTSPVVEKSVRLLDAALDYVVSLEANSYFPAFDRDRHGFPDMSSLVMGHRLYQSASLKTFRPNRSVAATLVDECPYEHPHKWGAWAISVRRFLVDSLVQLDDAAHVKADMFLAHPLAECVCRSNAGEVVTHGADGASSSHRARVKEMLVREGVTVCPAWMA